MKTIFKQFEQCITLKIYKIKKIKFYIAEWIIIIAALMTIAPSCDKNFLENSTSLLSGGDANSNYEYYKGVIPNSCYSTIQGERAVKITGKPFMAVKYERATHRILDFDFGLSEVTQTLLTGVVPVPAIDISAISYRDKLNLVGPIISLVNWPTAFGETVTNGSLNAGGYWFYYSGHGTKWSFSYLPAGSMTGGAVWLGGEGYETDKENSFNMLRQ